MADRANPVDESLMDLATARHRLQRYFGRDGVIDADEAGLLAAFAGPCAGIGAYRARERLMSYWLKGGDLASDYGHGLERNAEARIVSFDSPVPLCGADDPQAA